MRKNKRDLNITAKEFKEADKYIFTAEKITKNGITCWNFYLLKNGKFKKVVGGRTWREKGLEGYHFNNAFGINRALDLLLVIGQDLGLKIEEIDQGKIMIL